MTSFAINAHEKDFPVFSKRVWFEGDGALVEGQGLCYNWDYGTPTVPDGRRGNRVELPAILNAPYFAGVADKPYSATTGGQFITINLPGSFCNIQSAKASTTIGVGVATFEVGTGGTGAGYFGRAGFAGRGTANILETTTEAGLCFAYLQDGPQSGGIEVHTPVANTVSVLMVGGVTYLIGTVDNTAGAPSFAFVDGTYPDQRKAFVCEGTYSNNEFEITLATSGLDLDSTTGLISLDFNADLEEATLVWKAFDTNGFWVVEHLVGASTNAS